MRHRPFLCHSWLKLNSAPSSRSGNGLCLYERMLCLPSSSQEKKPSLNHNFYDPCSCVFYYCSFGPHPLLLSTSSGTLQSLTQLHWSPSSHTLLCLQLLTPVRVLSWLSALICTWFMIMYCRMIHQILYTPTGIILPPPMIHNHIYHSNSGPQSSAFFKMH